MRHVEKIRIIQGNSGRLYIRFLDSVDVENDFSGNLYSDPLFSSLEILRRIVKSGNYVVDLDFANGVTTITKRAQLRADNERMRAALELIRDHDYPPFGPDAHGLHDIARDALKGGAE